MSCVRDNFAGRRAGLKGEDDLGGCLTLCCGECSRRYLERAAPLTPGVRGQGLSPAMYDAHLGRLLFRLFFFPALGFMSGLFSSSSTD